MATDGEALTCTMFTHFSWTAKNSPMLYRSCDVGKKQQFPIS